MPWVTDDKKHRCSFPTEWEALGKGWGAVWECSTCKKRWVADGETHKRVNPATGKLEPMFSWWRVET
jgi:hypothetical protein